MSSTKDRILIPKKEPVVLETQDFDSKDEFALEQAIEDISNLIGDIITCRKSFF